MAALGRCGTLSNVEWVVAAVALAQICARHTSLKTVAILLLAARLPTVAAFEWSRCVLIFSATLS